MTWPVIQSPGAISRFLEIVRHKGVPRKVDVEYLKSVGLKAANDAALIRTFTDLGFIDSSGTPTQRWHDYRGPEGERFLRDGIRERYAELFEVFPSARAETDESLADWFRSKSSGSELQVRRALRTFRALCSAARMGDEEQDGTDRGEMDPKVPEGEKVSSAAKPAEESARDQTVSSDPETHSISLILRRNVRATLSLPYDLRRSEADRLIALLETLIMEEVAGESD